nr:uncharacterized protein LOC117278306 [Nicotiana tomentosiformis]
MFFDGAVNAKGVGIGAILISPTGKHYPATTQLRFFYTNNTAEYEAYIMGMNMAVDLDVEELLIMWDSNLIIRQAQGEWETRDIKLIPYRQHVEDLSKRFKSVEFKYISRFHNDLADALATLASMLPYPDNAANLNNHLIREVCEQFKITHRNSTPYRPKANGVVEAANKNIKNILMKMIQSSKQWHEKLSFAFLGYRTTVRTSVGATPYLLVYGTEAVILVEVEIPSLWFIVEAEIEDYEWVKIRIARAYNKKVRPRKFKVGQLVLRRILPHHEEAKGEFAQNWKGPYIIRKVLPKRALYLGDIEGNDPETAVNENAVKMYYI